MTGLNHALTGAAVAAAVNRPILALPAALLSHFAIDIIPHWDYKVPGGLKGRQKVMTIDLVLSLLLLAVLALTIDATHWVILAGGLLGILPDVMWLDFFRTGNLSPSHNRLIQLLQKFHLWIQWNETAKGFFVELLWFPLILWLIYQVHH